MAEAGAINLFSTIYDSTITDRQSRNRKSLKKEHGLALLKNVGVRAHPRTVKSAAKASSDSQLKTVQEKAVDSIF